VKTRSALRRRWLCVMSLVLLVAASRQAAGEVISYRSDAAPIFGEPAVYGNSLLFIPADFASVAASGRRTDLVSGLMRVGIESSGSIEHVRVDEGGGWFFLGSASPNTQASVAALAAELVITEVDGVPVANGPLITIPGVMNFSPTSNGIGSAAFSAADPVDPAGWRGQMVFDDVSSALVGSLYQGKRVTGATLVFNNVLSTKVNEDAVALINEQWLTITTAPEPSTLGLLAVTVVAGAICSVRNRRRSVLERTESICHAR
jgi:hypothetical protein